MKCLSGETCGWIQALYCGKCFSVNLFLSVLFGYPGDRAYWRKNKTTCWSLWLFEVCGNAFEICSKAFNIKDHNKGIAGQGKQSPRHSNEHVWLRDYEQLHCEISSTMYVEVILMFEFNFALMAVSLNYVNMMLFTQQIGKRVVFRNPVN